MHRNAKTRKAEAGHRGPWVVRFVRGVVYFVFSRYMLWTLAVLTLLVVLFYQYENWKGGRDLREARRKLIERAGTDDYMDFVPAEIPEAENFFAIPLIAGWRQPGPFGDSPSYSFPHKKLMPETFGAPPEILEVPGCFQLDVIGWAKVRTPGGKMPPDRKAAAKMLVEELGDGGGIIDELAKGLNRPGVQLVPCLRSRIAGSRGNPMLVSLPGTKNGVPFQRALGIHLRAAALAGDAGRTKSLTGIMLRLAKVWSGEPGMIGGLIGQLENNVTLQALNEALTCPGLSADDFREMGKWLAEENDLEVLERSFLYEAFMMNRQFEVWKKDLRGDWKSQLDLPVSGLEEMWMVNKMMYLGPSGWWDMNQAFACEMLTGHCGTKGEDWWRSGKTGPLMTTPDLKKTGILFTVGKTRIPNPRRYLATETWAVVRPVGLWDRSVDNLILRRCAILTCALHRHRLAHGGFPEKLEALDAGLLPGPQNDPEKSGAALHYRRTEKGFVLWSVGRDGEDNGGDVEKDAVWRHGR